MLLSTPIVQMIKRDPISIEVTASVVDAIQILANANFHHLPVVDQKRLVGIVSTTDILKLNGEALSAAGDSNPALLASRACVGDIMIKEVIPLSERATIEDAARLLSNGEFHSVPVISARGELIGIVTTTDLMAQILDTPAKTELPETVEARMQLLEKVYEAAENYLSSDGSSLPREQLEKAVHEARWAA